MVNTDSEVIHDAAGRRWGQRLLDAALSLQCKATLLVVVLTLSVTTAVAGYLLQSSAEFARDQRDMQAVQSASVLANAAAAYIVRGDYDGLKALATESANGQPLLYAIFSDAEGRQLAVGEYRKVKVLQSLQRDSSERVPVPGQPIFRSGGENVPIFVDVTFPITIRSTDEQRAYPYHKPKPTRLLGYVRAGTLGNSWQSTIGTKIDLLIGVALLTTVAAIPLGFFLIRRIVVPLYDLAQSMDQFSEGELAVRSPVQRRDEIGRLAAAFNRMADQHQNTHERIVRLNQELEKRVASRTHQLRELALREPLTGLYNRRHFDEMLERRYAEAVRYHADLSCIMIDLDEFKGVNDAFGHHVGDELLVLTAATITSQLRSSDVAARFGGDEFTVLLPQTDTDQARVLGERIMEKFTRDVAERLPQAKVSMSLGIASVPSSEIKDAASLIRTADQALYEAKAAGKNRIVTSGATDSKPAVV